MWEMWGVILEVTRNASMRNQSCWKKHHDTTRKQVQWPHSWEVTREQVGTISRPRPPIRASTGVLWVNLATTAFPIPGPILAWSLHQDYHPDSILFPSKIDQPRAQQWGDHWQLGAPPPSLASCLLPLPLVHHAFHPLPSLLSWLHGQTPDMLLVFILMICSCKAQYFTSIACVTG